MIFGMDSAVIEAKKKGVTSNMEIAAGLVLEMANRIKELEKQLKPDLFWNEDGDESFDSPSCLAEYQLDADSKVGDKFMVRQAVSLPDAEYKITKIDDITSSVECELVTQE